MLLLPMLALFLLVVGLCTKDVQCEEQHIGKRLGELNSYHHQVGGEVFAVNENTLLIKGFMYDGNGKDTFFWAGSRPRPGPQGFIVPNEYGRTNILESYRNKDITITLPDGKKIQDIKWVAVYDLSRLESFGDVYIQEGFEPPRMIVLPRFKSRQKRVSSDDVVVMDSKSLFIKRFRFDGRGEVYFWVGVGPQPHNKGVKIPDEHGYMTALAAYRDADILLTLPGERDVFTTDWLALYDAMTQEIIGHIIIPAELNVPPSLVTITKHQSPLPHCEQLHRNIQLSWDIHGSVITMQLAAKMGPDDYVSFGVSGDPDKPQMVNGDVVVAYRDQYNGYVKDFNITSYFPCTELVGNRRGVCEDEDVKGQANYQPLTSSRMNGVSEFNFRRPMITPDHGDKPYMEIGETQIIWSMGRLNHLNTQPMPTMHEIWAKQPQPITFKRTPSKNCFAFTHEKDRPVEPWTPVYLTHPSANLTFRLGPDGGPKGYTGLTKGVSSSGLAWYVDGFLTPELYLRRDTQYRFLVYGGSNIYDPANYHPLIITDEPHGGFSQLTPEEQKEVRIFAGIESTVRGDIRPMRGGDLCLWKHPPELDRRRDAGVQTFVDFRNSLTLECGGDGSPEPGILSLQPNRSWPDLLYYNSWTGENMGWKVHILDADQAATSNISPAKPWRKSAELIMAFMAYLLL